MAIIGICGKMGSRMYDYYKDEFTIIGIDLIKHPVVQTYNSLKECEGNVDVIVDFSSVECFDVLLEGLNRGIPILSGTTGYKIEEIDTLNQLAREKNTPFVWKANYAKGIKLFSKLIQSCKNEFELLDFIEVHATTKKDAPSGTAKVLANELGISENKIQSLRINQAPAIHEILFSSLDERVILRHEIINKKAFITGFDEELRKVI